MTRPGAALPAVAAAVAAVALLVVPALALAGAAAGPAPSPTAAVVDVYVTAQDDGQDFWFTVEGLAGRDPDIRVAPGAEVHLHVRNNGTVAHNFWVEALGGVACCLAPNATADAIVRMPTSDTAVAYKCQPHDSAGMHGRFVVGLGPDKGTPGPGLLLGLAGIVVAVAVRQVRKPYGEDPRRRTR